MLTSVIEFEQSSFPQTPRSRKCELDMPSETERQFVLSQRVGRLATADRNGAPHVLPVGFALEGNALYITIDDKPKRTTGRKLKRLQNIIENPHIAVVIDRYDEDWSRLGWVMLRGRAEILDDGEEHDTAQTLLRARYPQLLGMQIAGYPVIALRIERTTSWGNLGA